MIAQLVIVLAALLAGVLLHRLWHTCPQPKAAKHPLYSPGDPVWQFDKHASRTSDQARPGTVLDYGSGHYVVESVGRSPAWYTEDQAERMLAPRTHGVGIEASR